MEEVAFKDLDAAILVGSMPRKEGMERKDLLKANVTIFKSQGSALEKFSKKTVKVKRVVLKYSSLFLSTVNFKMRSWSRDGEFSRLRFS